MKKTDLIADSVDITNQTVTLRNSHNNPTVNGGVLITLSLEELKTYFTSCISN